MIGYCVFSEWGVAPLAPIWMQGDAYFADLSVTMGESFAESYVALSLPWIIPDSDGWHFFIACCRWRFLWQKNHEKAF